MTVLGYENRMGYMNIFWTTLNSLEKDVEFDCHGKQDTHFCQTTTA